MSAFGPQYQPETKPLGTGQTERRYFTVIDGDEIFGLPVQSVQTIFRIDEVTPVPLGPADVEGLVNLRGRIVTAVSLKRRLAKAPLDCLRGELAIGIEHDGESFALIVDEVGDVIACEEAAEITHPPQIEPGRAHLTKTYYGLDSGILPILDMNAVFNLAERGRSGGSVIHNAAVIRSDQ